MKSITGITRGCGKREVGGLYICCGLSRYGKPLEYFIIDPSIPVEYRSFRAPIWVNENTLLMWVGTEHYRFPSDFIEEVRLFGVSKRIPTNFEIEKLRVTTKMAFVHARAIVLNQDQFPAPKFCPKKDSRHLQVGSRCLGIVYSLAPGENNTRKVGDTEYPVFPFSENNLPVPTYSQGIFLVLPITHLDFVIGKNPDPTLFTVADNLKTRAESVGLTLNIEEE